jgi:hypothetical protein
MVVEGATLKGGLKHWTVKGKIRRGILKQCKLVFFFFFAWSISRDSGLVFFWLIVVIFCFHCTSTYTVANNVS